MKGIGAIIHKGGWAISNEVVFDYDKYLIEVEGKKISKNVLTIKLFHIFEVQGAIEEGQPVECIFKSEEDVKHAFTGVIKIKKGTLTTIYELLKSERYNEILNKIKT